MAQYYNLMENQQDGSGDKDIDNLENEEVNMRIQKTDLVKNYGNSFYDVYLKERLIGSGGYGTVHLITHKQLKVKRALKTIQKYKGARSTIDELQLLKKLDHPNILKIYEYFQTSEQWLIVTEYFQGRQIIEQVLENKFLSEKRTAAIIYEILKALNYIHGRNIAHRDIKAENVLVSKDEKGDCAVKVIDWGFAAPVPSERFQNACGTIYYMAPEVITGTYGLECDMWSLGVLTFAMLNGSFPFGGARSSDTETLIKKAEIKFPQKASISQPAKEFICSLLEKDLSKRLTAKQALQHPWILLHTSQQQQQDEINLKETLQRLKVFYAQNKFQVVIINYITNYIELPKQEARLRREFDLLDKNKDGSISQKQLIEAYRKIYGPDGDLIIQKIFQTIDLDKSGDLSYSEYITFATRINYGFSEEQLKQAFKLFDNDGNGLIDRQEIVDILHSGIGDIHSQELKDFVKQIDINNDGKIDFAEFVEHINKAAQKRSINSQPVIQP